MTTLELKERINFTIIQFISDKFSPFVNERQLFSGKKLDGKDITYRNYTLI